MNLEKDPKPIDPQPELSKVEIPTERQTDASKELTSHNRELEETEAKKQDKAEIAKIEASLDLEQATEQKQLKRELQKYLDLKEGAVERIALLKAKDLPNNYQTQYEFLHDKRLDEVTIAVVPDDLWIKGSQPSESNAEEKLILIKQSYFEPQKNPNKPNNPDEIAWLCHELAHCQSYFASESLEEYQGKMQKFAFEDLKTDHTYPNNPVEQYAFTTQFQYLIKQGKSREDILAMLGDYYHKEDFPFFERLLDTIETSSLIQPLQQAKPISENFTEIEIIKGRQYHVEYVPKERIYPAYGYGGGNSAVVRQDLPPRVKKFVKAHELYHCQDQATWGGWLGREIRANVVPGLKDPIGLAATVWETITDLDRIKFYLKRIKRGY